MPASLNLLRGLSFGCILAVAAFVCNPASAIAAPTELTLTVREQLNQSYGRELVSYPFSAAAGQCAPGSLRLTGPGGATPVQLTDVTWWDEARTFVKTARLTFVVEDLQALAVAPYTLHYGPVAADAPAPTSDLRVTRAADQVDIATARIALSIRLGGATLTPPVAAKELRGPVLGLGPALDAMAGGSNMTGDDLIASWSSEVVEAGPVLVRVVSRCTFVDGNVATLTATVVAGDNTVNWEFQSLKDHPENGFELRLPPLAGVEQVLMPKGYGQWARADRTAPLKPGAEPFAWLSPNSSVVNIFADSPPVVRLIPAGGGAHEIYLASHDPAAWVDAPAPLTMAGFKTWNLDMVSKAWELWQRKRLALSYAADGVLTMRATCTAGNRKWSTGDGAPLVGDRLDTIKDMVLDWTADPKQPSPRVYVGLPEIKDAWARSANDPVLAKILRAGNPQGATQAAALLMKPEAQRAPKDVAVVVEKLREQLALMGNFDVMRGAITTATYYDMVVDSDLLTPADRTLFRAQMAYLTYLLADPMCWNMERGYLSGNPNMSLSYTLSLGVAACALRDHPAAPEWAARATAWMDKWLADEVGPNGEWMPEGSHYGYVSLEPLVAYAVAAKRAGFHDFSDDARLKKVIVYFAKYNTPRDIQFKNERGIGAYGRGHGGKMAVFGTAAAFYKDSDPELSRTLQWLWAENGYPLYIADGRLGGVEPYYADRRLPAVAPAWSTELFPTLGAIFRDGFGTDHESYVNVLAAVDSTHNLDIWTPGVGGISQWFGRGKPLSTCFTYAIGYNERHELLRDGVRLARNWGAEGDAKGPFGQYTTTAFGGFTTQPGADYVTSTFTNTKVDDRDWFPDNVPAFPKVTAATANTLTWTRQVLFVKDDALGAAAAPDSDAPAYLVVRDTTSGGQPTAWQFWTLSDKVGTPEQARDVDAFLADKPGQKVLPARELPAGDRYTALGQFGMDVEYFVASPSATPRHTLRYGGMGRVTRVPEYQDLLHLQLPGDGAYYVVIYPRPRAEAAPSFTKLANDAILKIVTPVGVDYVCVAASPMEAAADGVRFKGPAGVVQQRGALTRLTLAAAGDVASGDLALSGPGAATLVADGKGLTLSAPATSSGGVFTLHAAAGLKPVASPDGVVCEVVDGGYRLTLPAGAVSVILNK